MSTRLEIAENKLARLEKEAYGALDQSMAASSRVPFGQPNIIGRPDIYRDSKRLFNKSLDLHNEAVAQAERVEKLRRHAENKEKGLRKNGDFDFQNIDNIPALERMIAEQEANRELWKTKKEGPGYNLAKLHQWERKLAALKELAAKVEMGSATITPYAQSLIDDGYVKQWAKKPIFYFVNGLRKVALEIDNETGDFIISPKYPTKTLEEETFVNNLLAH